MEVLGRLAGQAAAVGEKLAICYEASCGYGHLFEQFSKVAAKVVVAHPGKLRLIYQSKRKNNAVDAAKLATLLLVDQVPQVWVPRQDVRAWRRIIEHRRRTMDKRTMCKNQIRALLRTHGISSPPRKKLWTQKQRPWLRAVELPTSSDALQRDILLEELEHQDRQVARATRALDRIAEDHPGVMLLRTIPGVGPRTAEAVVAYIDEARRFRRSKCIGAYLGLVPCQDASAGVNRLGHITRQGPPTVRKLLIEAAWQGIRRSPRIRAFYERIVGGKEDRRKIALVATAHWLARVMLAMLRSGEAWRHEQEAAEATPLAA
jgi:transposase